MNEPGDELANCEIPCSQPHQIHTVTPFTMKPEETPEAGPGVDCKADDVAGAPPADGTSRTRSESLNRMAGLKKQLGRIPRTTESPERGWKNAQLKKRKNVRMQARRQDRELPTASKRTTRSHRHQSPWKLPRGGTVPGGSAPETHRARGQACREDVSCPNTRSAGTLHYATSPSMWYLQSGAAGSSSRTSSISIHCRAYASASSPKQK